MCGVLCYSLLSYFKMERFLSASESRYVRHKFGRNIVGMKGFILYVGFQSAQQLDYLIFSIYILVLQLKVLW